MYAIVGSGFGLYGYLPALTEGQGEMVLLPRAYEAKVLARPELAGALPRIRWVDDEEAALAQASAVVIATPPKRQCEVVSRCLALPNIEKFVLEKPLAVSPAHAVALLAKLDISEKRYRIGYTFLHTGWQQELPWPKASPPSTKLSIVWTFMAHHFQTDLTTWKRVHNEGGGALRFYGIQLLALLTEHGYDGVRSSVLKGEDDREPECWDAVFTGTGLPECYVHVDSRSTTKRFAITRFKADEADVLLRLADPFEHEIHKSGADTRVGVLNRLLETFQVADQSLAALYNRVNLLWQKVEDV